MKIINNKTNYMCLCILLFAFIDVRFNLYAVEDKQPILASSQPTERVIFNIINKK